MLGGVREGCRRCGGAELYTELAAMRKTADALGGGAAETVRQWFRKVPIDGPGGIVETPTPRLSGSCVRVTQSSNGPTGS